MDGPIPLGLPAATALYVSLYLVTLALHVGFMSYVLAGSGYLAVTSAWRGASGGRADPIADTLRDWLPFFLGLAITAGVAPLLFLQVLYKESFYTANLLLLHRWMVMIPLLMIGFYLLYLGKTSARRRWGGRAGTAIAAVAFGCFVYAGYSWTENHALALERAEWVEFFASGALAYVDGQVVIRFATWLCGAVPLMAVTVGWQLRHADRAEPPVVRRLSALAILGIGASAGLGTVYANRLAAPVANGLESIGPYLAILIGALLLQSVAWAWQWLTGRLDGRALVAASAGGVVAVLAVALIRESLRLATAPIEVLSGVHERTAESGGRWLFAAFLIGNAVLIAWCLRTALRGRREPADRSSTPPSPPTPPPPTTR